MILGVTSTVEILKCNIFLIHILVSGLLVRKAIVFAFAMCIRGLTAHLLAHVTTLSIHPSGSCHYTPDQKNHS